MKKLFLCLITIFSISLSGYATEETCYTQNLFVRKSFPLFENVDNFSIKHKAFLPTAKKLVKFYAKKWKIHYSEDKIKGSEGFYKRPSKTTVFNLSQFWASIDRNSLSEEKKSIYNQIQDNIHKIIMYLNQYDELYYNISNLYYVNIINNTIARQDARI